MGMPNAPQPSGFFAAGGTAVPTVDRNAYTQVLQSKSIQLVDVEVEFRATL